jgi:hypothetical protein
MSEAVEIVVEPPAVPSAPVNADQIPPIDMEEEFFGEDLDFDCLTVKITPVGARLERPDDPAYFKNVSLKSLARAIMDDASIDTGLLPLYGNSYIGIRRYMQFKDTHLVFVEASAGKRKAKYDSGNNDEDPSDYIIPHPYLLMAIKLKETGDGTFKVAITRLFAMKTPLISDDAQLYKYPYGNVYTSSSGKICWGGYQRQVDRSRYSNIMQSGELVNLFLNTGYNDDLFHREALPIRDVNSFRDVYSHMESKDEYPYETLTETIKLNELISLLKNN